MVSTVRTLGSTTSRANWGAGEASEMRILIWETYSSAYVGANLAIRLSTFDLHSIYTPIYIFAYKRSTSRVIILPYSNKLEARAERLLGNCNHSAGVHIVFTKY